MNQQKIVENQHNSEFCLFTYSQTDSERLPTSRQVTRISGCLIDTRIIVKYQPPSVAVPSFANQKLLESICNINEQLASICYPHFTFTMTVSLILPLRHVTKKNSKRSPCVSCWNFKLQMRFSYINFRYFTPPETAGKRSVIMTGHQFILYVSLTLNHPANIRSLNLSGFHPINGTT